MCVPNPITQPVVRSHFSLLPTRRSDEPFLSVPRPTSREHTLRLQQGEPLNQEGHHGLGNHLQHFLGREPIDVSVSLSAVDWGRRVIGGTESSVLAESAGACRLTLKDKEPTLAAPDSGGETSWLPRPVFNKRAPHTCQHQEFFSRSLCGSRSMLQGDDA